MKRFFKSSVLLLALLFSFGKMQAQLTPSLNPGVQCPNATNFYTINCGLFLPVPGAVTYSWSIFSNNGCVATFTNGQWGGVINPASSASQIAISTTCCGQFTVINYPFSFSGTTPILISAAISQTVFEIVCPSSGSVAVSNTAVCLGNNVVYTGIGQNPAANSYTWSNGFVGNPVIISPTVNTCLTFTGTSTQGCTYTPASSGCSSVQAISATVSPSSQTICVGAPICLSVIAAPVTGSNVLPGTVITNTTWLSPTNVILASSCTTAAQAGVYTAQLTHTGVAGTCTYNAVSTVVTSTNISVTASASAPSVCPGATVQLTASSIQTAAASYTWTKPNAPFPAFVNVTGNPIVATNSLATLVAPTVYQVNVNYFGCPGTAQVTVGMLTISPTLTPSSFSVCPNTPITFTASGGTNYTFRYWNNCLPPPTSNTIIGTASSTVFIRTHTPSLTACWPQIYSVSSTSNGCTGSSTITVYERTLVPTLSASTPSACPGSSFALIGGGVGTGVTYTYSSGYSPNIGVSTGSISHSPLTNTTLPHMYTVLADSAGCVGTATFTVNKRTLYPTLTPSAFSVCPGNSMSITVSGGLDTYDTLRGPFEGAPPPTFLAAQAGTSNTVFSFTPALAPGLPYTYTVTTDSLGCHGTNTIQIGLLNLGPKINLTSSSASICPNTTFSLYATTASGANSYTYSFYGPSGTTNTLLTTTSATVAAATPTSLNANYTVYADSAGCVGSATITIYEKVLHPIIVASNSVICKNTAVSLTISNVGYNSSNSYTFGIIAPTPSVLPSGTTFSYTTHTPTFTPLGPSTPIVYTALVDSAGCKSSTSPPATFTLNFRPDLVLSPSSSAASVCPGTAATVAVAGPTYVTWPLTYTWSQSAGTGSIGSTINNDSLQVFPTSNSTYSVNASDTAGCIGSTVIAIGIDPTISFPVALASSGSTICAGQSVTLTATSTITTYGTMSYSWTPSSTIISPNNQVTVVASPSASTIYSLVVANQFGCVSGNTISVPMGQYPATLQAVSATANSVCVGFTSTLTAFGAQSYTWTSNTFTGGIAQQSISAQPGNYTVTLSNGGSCISTRSISIDTLALIPIHVSVSSGTTCIESNFPKFSKPVKLVASGASNYVWFPYNPLNMTYSIGSTTDVRPSATTQYTVIGSTNVCANSTVVTVTVVPQFSLNVVPPLPAMCLGDSLKLVIAGTGTNAVGPVSAFTYSWSEPGNAPPISLSNNLTPTVIAFPQNTSTYTVEVKDSRKCISFPRLTTVTVLPRPLTSIAIPTINSVATNTVCYVGLNPGAPDVTIDLQAVNQNQNLQFGVVPTYTWLQPYNIKYNSILTPSNNAGITINAPVKSPSVVIYTVVSGYNGVPGCLRLDTVSVRVVDCRPVRDVVFTTTEVNDTICARNCITFQNLTDTMAGGPQKLNWQFPGGSPSTSTLQIPTICYNLPGKYNVILGVSNPYPISSGGSSLTVGKLSFVKVVDVPNVTIIVPGQERSDTTVRFGTAIKLNGSGALTYNWFPNYNITSLNNPSVTVNPFKTTQYILTGFNSGKCYSSDTLNVIVIEDCGEMYVPNAFSPNNDGANDVLYVRGICLESLTFMVFDRWGEKVFETNDQKVGWDGTYKGVMMNTGVFVFRLEGKTYDGKGYSLKGNVTLLR